jgi:hypothetical protein
MADIIELSDNEAPAAWIPHEWIAVGMKYPSTNIPCQILAAHAELMLVVM